MTTRALWQGRALALVGIVLVAFSLRSAVASLSPVLDLVQHDFAVPPVVIGLIGAAPSVCFAIFGLITPLLERRFGLVLLAIGSAATMTIGLIVRGLSGNSVMLLVTTIVIFAGVGAGNVIIPPLVKRYFPDRLGVMMTVYSTTMAFSTFVPPLLAVPVADAAGWRSSLAMWGLFACAAFIPWAVLFLRERAGVSSPPPAHTMAIRTHSDDLDAVVDASDPASVATGPIAVVPPSGRVFGRMWKLLLPWSLAIVFSVSATLAYVFFAWLPSIVVDVAGASAAEAGQLLSLFGVVSLPCALLVPILVVRFGATRAVFFVGVAVAITGILGLMLAPGVGVALWVGIAGLAGMMFPLCLVLLSIRARHGATAIALSGFVQSIGYAIASIFPPLVGVLHDVSGGWTLPLSVIIGFVVLAIPAGWVAGRRQTVEEEWERRYGRW